MAATADSSLPFPVSDYPPEVTDVVFPIAKAIYAHKAFGDNVSILVLLANGFGVAPVMFVAFLIMMLAGSERIGPGSLLVLFITGCITALDLATWVTWRLRRASLTYSLYLRFTAAFPPGSARRAEAEAALARCLDWGEARSYLYVTDRAIRPPFDLQGKAAESREPVLYRLRRWGLFLAMVAAWCACLRYVPGAMAERWLRSQAEAALETVAGIDDRLLPDHSRWGRIVVWDVLERTRSDLERELPEEMLAEPGELPVTFVLLTVKRNSEKDPQAPARADVVSQPGNWALGHRDMPLSQVVSWLQSRYVPPPPRPSD